MSLKAKQVVETKKETRIVIVIDDAADLVEALAAMIELPEKYIKHKTTVTVNSDFTTIEVATMDNPLTVTITLPDEEEENEEDLLG